MGFRFFRRKTLFPGVTLNFSKSGASVSFGPRGAKVTVGPKGIRTTIGLPGSGIHWTEFFSYSSQPSSETVNDSSEQVDEGTPYAPRASETLSEGPQNFPSGRLALIDQKFVDALRMADEGSDDTAIAELVSIAKLRDDVDAAFLAGVLLLRNQRPAEGEQFLITALNGRWELGNHLKELGIEAKVQIEVADDLRVVIEPNYRGVLIALAETFQALGRHQDAVKQMQRLLQLTPDDCLVRMSIVELLVVEGKRESNWKTAVRLASVSPSDLQQVSPAAIAGLSYFKGIACKRLGQLSEAEAALQDALKSAATISGEFDSAVRYQLALLHEATGNRKAYISELRQLQQNSPDYEDVVARLDQTAD